MSEFLTHEQLEELLEQARYERERLGLDRLPQWYSHSTLN